MKLPNIKKYENLGSMEELLGYDVFAEYVKAQRGTKIYVRFMENLPQIYDTIKFKLPGEEESSYFLILSLPKRMQEGKTIQEACVVNLEREDIETLEAKLNV